MRGQTTLDFAIGVSVFLIVVTFVLAFVPGMLQPFQASTQQETAAADRLAEQLASDVLVADVGTPYVLDRDCTAAFFESRSDGNDPGGDDTENINGPGGTGFTKPFPSATFSGGCNFEDIPVGERLALGDLDVRIKIVADLEVGELDNPDEDSNDDFDGDTDDDEPEILCIDENSGNRFIEGGDPVDPSDGDECDITGGDDDIAFQIGETPPTDTSSVIVARRYVRIEGGFGDGNDEATLIVEVW